jgi:hypothetical protein
MSQTAGRRSGGKAPRAKGNRGERHIVRYLQGAGFAAERIPCSGSAGGSFSGDVTVPVLGIDRIIEVKCQASRFGTLYKWLEGRDFLILKNDRQEFLVVAPLRTAIAIAKAAERAKD